jgi:HK97 family phage portal protein
MGWINRIAGAFARKDSAIGPMISMRRVGKAIWTDRNYRGFAKEGYQQNVVAYRSIRMIAENVAAVLDHAVAYEGGKELTEHPLLAVLSRPNPWQSGSELVDALVSYFKIHGDGMLEAVMLDGQLREIYALRPDRMKVVPGRRGYPQAWEYSVDGTTKHTFNMDRISGGQLPIMHLREFNPLDDWMGLSPVEPAAFAIDVHNAAGNYNKALLDNSAAPSGALVYERSGDDDDGTLTNDQFERLKAQFAERHTGARNAGKPLILEGGLKWQAMGMSPKDMEFTSGKREAAREIALAFGVPTMLLGIPGDNTFSNYQEARLALYEETVLPLAGKILKAITNWMQPTYPGVTLGYDEDAIPAMVVRREAAWKRVQDADFITTDEKRAATGYGEYAPDGKPGGTILVGGTMMPLDEAGFQPGGAAPDGQ